MDVPHSWMVEKRKSQSKMNGDPHDLGNHQITVLLLGDDD